MPGLGYTTCATTIDTLEVQFSMAGRWTASSTITRVSSWPSSEAAERSLRPIPARIIEGMEARYLTNESGDRIGVVLHTAEYERLRRPAEEVARAERHPGIAFRGTEGSRRAWMPDTALDVWEIVAGYEELGRQRFLKETGISQDHLDVALAYHQDYQDEVEF
jgi:hypothetical protein